MHQNHVIEGKVADDVRRYPCQLCPETFTRKDNLKRHVRQKHDKMVPKPRCPNCRKELSINFALKRHMEKCCHPGNRGALGPPPRQNSEE
ncbi:GDNF-inducible zinc finger protein 1 isoform X2 [Folsomia candida]|uniref:GDNF-inducible zinc finger protein 1 isoform X2 n=1 Tax=Folsomia candida TaxID=158441 RepID=UPI001604DF89|nr:GDNF-inducible zinc finger protein 1 isoform X2 [Folsomia candida]